MERSKEEKEAHHRALLKDDDDVRLFTNGGCGVFAKAIHEAFGYEAASWASTRVMRA